MSEPLYDDEGVTTVSKTTPLHDITWYVKWAGTIILVFAVSARSIGPDVVPNLVDQSLSLMGLLCWFFVAFKWHDRALMTVNAICLPLLIAGIIRSIFT
jgi:hypothetical protein|tara:strand:+ start:821 stop:1117 length:297 start_codon:yes stop_codon:yes gene_type:complete